MDSNKRKVKKFIMINFDLDDFEMEDWPLLPGGILLKCKDGGTVLVWSDILSNSIYYSINGEPAVKRALPKIKE